MLLFASAVKAVAEIALMALIGQWMLGMLAGDQRDRNLFYQVLAAMTRPFLKLARWISPPVVLDRHVPLVAFLLLSMGWLCATYWKVNLCLHAGADACR